MFKRVIVPLDRSQLSEAALDAAKHVARCKNVEMQLIRVTGSIWIDQAIPANQLLELENMQRSSAETYLERLAAEVRAEGFTVSTAVIEGEPAAEILHVANQDPGNLVVMATHGLSGIIRFQVGSIADKVVSRSKVPVMLVRPQIASVHARQHSSEN